MIFSARLACISSLMAFIAACGIPASTSVSQFDQGDYVRSAKGLRALADEGNPQAQAYLGYLYQYGIGSEPQDEAKALQLFQQAAAQGYSPARNFEGVLYVIGSATPHDYSRAVSLFEASAATGDPLAKANLAIMYDAGWGVPQDTAMGKKLRDEIGQFQYPPMDRYAHAIRGCVEQMKFYPRSAAEQRHSGIATVGFAIDRRIAMDVHIVKSSGSPDLDSALVQTVEACMFPYPPPGLIPPGNFIVAEDFSL